MYDKEELEKHVRDDLEALEDRVREDAGVMKVSLTEAEQKVIEEREDGREDLYDLLDKAAKGQVMRQCDHCGTKFVMHPGSNVCPCGKVHAIPALDQSGPINS